MDVSDFVAEYEIKADDELLCLYADRNRLVPEAVAALETEIQRRGLKKQNAALAKKRVETLKERYGTGSLAQKVATAKNEHRMRHVGPEEPEYVSPYSVRDPRGAFGYIRHKYRAWKMFRDRTGHWPVLSMWFFFLSWITVAMVFWLSTNWVVRQPWARDWKGLAAVLCIVAISLGLRHVGARAARRLDWARYKH